MHARKLDELVVEGKRQRVEPEPVVQRKGLEVGAAHDPAEQEADRVAAQVVRTLQAGAEPDTAESDIAGAAGGDGAQTVSRVQRSTRSPVDEIHRSGDQRIRRMPSAATIKDRTGKESKTGRKVFGKRFGATNSYNAVLAAVTTYRDFLSSTQMPPNEMLLEQQLGMFSSRLNAVVAAAQTYLAKKDTDPNVVPVCNELIEMAGHELRVARMIGTEHIKSGPKGNALGLGAKKWILEMPRDPRKTTSSDTVPEEVASGGQGGKGANKEVKKATSQGKEGFFASDVDENSGSAYDNPKGMMENYGNNETDLRLAERSIAMSRLDSLLGGGVIARTKAASSGSDVGTFMEKAEGNEAVQVLTNDPTVAKDPELARLLSRVQLIDAIAGQIDRHAKNYFVELDKSGNVIGVTGIDLDMSFMPTDQEGTRAGFDVEKGSYFKKDGGYFDYFPGFSKFVDAELAEVILKITPLDLRAIFSDLLEPWAIDAAIERLEQLQVLLQQLKNDNKLLQPNDWKNVLHEIVEEDKSYYAREAKATA